MDTKDRQRALNIQQSFIVQAPAGSGKTELLTQRFLSLLAIVEKPESIIALTFTRKAAQEMRHRILQALQEAHLNTPIKNEHQKTTRELAKKALKHHFQQHVDLLSHPQSLQITTFDAFCLRLYQAVPRSDQALIPELCQFPRLYYKNAIQSWFQYCRADEIYHSALKALLQQVNNHVEGLFEHLIHLLEKRDQWLGAINENKYQSQEDHLLTLQLCLEVHWERWGTCLEKNLENELLNLIQSLLNHVDDAKFQCLKNWTQFHQITSAQIKALTKLLFTEKKTLRNEFNQHIGLIKSKCEKSIYDALKKQSRILFESLQQESAFIETILQLSEFPHPQEAEIDWDLTKSYYQLLPLLVAHLHLEFEAKSQSDYIYVAQAALDALNETDLNLYLDASIHHLLIDEFQDTSWTQLQLIETLTAQWPDDLNKSLFIVGDPMQSIYRFRSADVGIFLEVQAKGLGLLKLTPLYLKQNFRSNMNLIQQFNQSFQSIFPRDAKIEYGGVTFHFAHPVIGPDKDSFIEATFYGNEEEQAQAIIEIIQKAKSFKPKTIAILVKKRKQLKSILSALHLHQEAFQGVDLYPLGERRHILDIWNLSKLILQPGDRLVELAVFRGPYVGLSLKELHYLANLNPKASIFSATIDLNMFSTGSKLRLESMLQWHDQAIKMRLQKPIVEIIQDFVQTYQLNKVLTASENQELLKFYEIIHYFSEHYAYPSIHDIEDFLNQTYVSHSEGFSLQVMTIHKSKGLEFDWVIIPNMGAYKNKPERFLWNKLRVLHPQSPLAMLFLPKTDNDDHIAFYKWHEGQQLRYENQRLCYVAFTRAKERLYLLDAQVKAHLGSFRQLFPEDFFQAGELGSMAKKEEKSLQRKLIPSQVYQNLRFHPKTAMHPPTPFETSYVAKQIGILTHLILQWIGEFHPISIDELPWDMLKKEIQHKSLPSKTFHQIQTYISRFFEHPIGQWIMQSHPEEHNEYACLIREKNIVREMIIDRTFVDNDTRWIIDYKTSDENPNYIKQLNHYAENLQKLFPQQKIACGIFYLATLRWHSWQFSDEFALES